jgi:hypothetical protein
MAFKDLLFLHGGFELNDLNKPFSEATALIRKQAFQQRTTWDETKCSQSFFVELFKRMKRDADTSTDALAKLYRDFYNHIISLINHRAKQQILHAHPPDYYNDHVSLYIVLWECLILAPVGQYIYPKGVYFSDYRQEIIDSIKYGQPAGLLHALRQLLGYSTEWQAYEAQLQAVLAYEPPRVHIIDLVQKPDSHFTTCANVIVLAYDNTLADDHYQPALAELLKSDTICHFRIDEDEDNEDNDQILSLEWRQAMQQTCLRNQANRAVRTALLCSSTSSTSRLHLGSYLWRHILYEFLEPLYVLGSI